MSNVSERKSARIYADSLVRAKPVSELPTCIEPLIKLADAWTESSELRSAMKNPKVTQKERVAVARELVSKIGSSDDRQLSNAVALLAEAGKLEILPMVAEEFQRMVNDLKGRLSLSVMTASEIADAEKSEYEQQVAKQFGSMASVSWHVDPKLLGGVQIRSGDRVLDASVAGGLERMREQLLEG